MGKENSFLGISRAEENPAGDFAEDTGKDMSKGVRKGLKFMLLLLVIFLLPIFFIVCLFEIIFAAFGFEGTASYKEASLAQEKREIKEALEYCFETGNTGDVEQYRGRVDLLFYDWGSGGNVSYSKYNVDEDGNKSVIPVAGMLAVYYREIDDDYTARWENAEENEKADPKVIYKGYKVECDYDTFWKSGEYLSLISSIIQSSGPDDYVSKICKNDDKEKTFELVYEILVGYFTVFKLCDVEAINVGAEPEVEYEDTKEDGKDVRNTFITYKIEVDYSKMVPEQEEDEEYFFVKKEEALDLAVQLIKDFEDGKFGATALDLIRLSGEMLSEKLKSVREKILEDDKYSYQNIRKANGETSGTGGTGSGAVSGGDYSLGENAAAYAKDHVGDTYDQSARMGEGTYDCSSLVARAYQSAGFSDLISADGWAFTAEAEYAYCQEYGQVLSSDDELQPGDLIFTTGGKTEGVGHVEIYIGDGQIVHAKGKNWGVVKEDFTIPRNLVAYARPYVAQSATAGDMSTVGGIYDFLVASGYTPAGACGILGNVDIESSFDPNAYNPKGGYYGLGQWSPSRQETLKSYCSANGYDYTTVEGQMYFLVYELAAYGSLDNYLRSAECTSPSLAAQEFACGFEGCVGTTGKGDAAYTGTLYPLKVGIIYQSLALRIASAQEAYDNYAK